MQGLNGTIDASWLALGGRIEGLTLDNNTIHGPLDPAWGLAWSNMTLLSLGNTRIQSTLPAGMAQMYYG